MNLSRCGILMLFAVLLQTSASCTNQNPPPAASRSRSPELAETTSTVPGERIFGNVDQYRSIDSYSFSTDMRYLVTAGDSGDLQLLELGSGTPAHALERHYDLTYVVAFAPDSTVFAYCGSLQVIGGNDGRHCDFALIDAATRSELRRLTNPDIVTELVFSPDGSLLAAGGGMSVTVYNVASGEVVWTQSSPDLSLFLPTCLAFSPDSQRLAVGLGTSPTQIRIWTLADDAEPVSFEAHATGEFQRVTGLAFSPNGTRIISGGEDGLIRISDSATGEQLGEIMPSEHDRYEIKSLSLSQDGETIAVARYSARPSATGFVELYDIATGEIRQTIRNADGWDVSFTPDGKSVAVRHYGVIRLMPLE